MTAMDVANAIRDQNLAAAPGQIGQPPAPAGQAFQLPIDTLGRLVDPEQFGDIDRQGRAGDGASLAPVPDTPPSTGAASAAVDRLQRLWTGTCDRRTPPVPLFVDQVLDGTGPGMVTVGNSRTVPPVAVTSGTTGTVSVVSHRGATGSTGTTSVFTGGGATAGGGDDDRGGQHGRERRRPPVSPRRGGPDSRRPAAPKIAAAASGRHRAPVARDHGSAAATPRRPTDSHRPACATWPGSSWRPRTTTSSCTFDGQPSVGLGRLPAARHQRPRRRRPRQAEDGGAEDAISPRAWTTQIAYDTTPFIRESIDEVFKTLLRRRHPGGHRGAACSCRTGGRR